MGYRKYVGLVTFVTLAFVHFSQADLLKVCVDTAACHTGGDANSVCAKKGETGGDDNGNCICNGTYKANVAGDACIVKALLQTCTNNAACQNTQSGGDAHAVCAKVGETGGDADGNCICNGTYKANIAGDACIAKALLQTCANNAACQNTQSGGDAHAVCAKVGETGGDADGNCICNGTYKANIAGDACIAKVLLQKCANNAACQNTQSGGDAHAVCAKEGETGGDPDGNCICNGTYKEKANACVVKAVSELDCKPADTDSTTGGTAVCKAVDAHANCPAGTSKCACNNGYKQDTTNVNTCVKVLGGTCSGSSSCTGADNSECSATSSKCVCVTNYIEDSSICKKALGQTCTKAEECVTNADCATTCKCSSGYINTGGLCALPSSASSVWMTTRVVVSSPLIYVLRLIY
ncbi:cell death abnormality protein 1-like [Mercenaria mercenaria]|uniref:cell death abnormality protein 1-like n=1 Tax=Mercenaria mercenaria TaxID=6596 RepID=UPI00234F239F|nr:cell death abnormality protein 1-like [Mercenaria mercenaria]